MRVKRVAIGVRNRESEVEEEGVDVV